MKPKVFCTHMPICTYIANLRIFIELFIYSCILIVLLLMRNVAL